MDYDDYTLVEAVEPPRTHKRLSRFFTHRHRGRRRKIIIVLSLLLLLSAIALIINSQNISRSVKKWNINSQGYSKIVEVADSQLGNGWQTYCNWWGFEGRDEWCAVFVCWCAAKAGYTPEVDYISSNGTNPDIGVDDDTGAGAGDHARFHEKLGRYYSAQSGYISQSGDFIYFDWNNDNYSEGKLVMDHIGIVEKVEHGVVYTVEGNSTLKNDDRDLVRRKYYDIDSSSIRGYSSVEKHEKLEYIE